MDVKNIMSTPVEMVDQGLLKILKSISQEDMGYLRADPKNRQWVKHVWHNGKHYRRESFSSVGEPATDLDGNVEVPNQREIFFIRRNSRFGFDDVEVAYFAYNTVLTTYETTPFFRYNPNLTWENDTQPYWEARSDPHPDSTKHDVKYKIESDSILLDLTEGGNFVRLIERSHPGFFQNVIINGDEEVYSQTRALARWSFDCGFDGIVYHSVRNTNDVKCAGKCLVMFSKEKVVKVGSMSGKVRKPFYDPIPL